MELNMTSVTYGVDHSTLTGSRLLLTCGPWALPTAIESNRCAVELHNPASLSTQSIRNYYFAP
jgi:hypothetical protein